ncbi:MAG: IPT/TIG domain-containing protein [Bacteroidota bacterium]
MAGARIGAGARGWGDEIASYLAMTGREAVQVCMAGAGSKWFKYTLSRVYTKWFGRRIFASKLRDMKNKYFALLAMGLLFSCQKSDTEIEPTPAPVVPTVTVTTFTALSPTSAKAGDILTLTGTNFSTTASENEVTFKTAATTTVNGTVKTASATTITVEVPATAITGTLILKVKGTAATLAASFSPDFTLIPPTPASTSYTQVITFVGGKATGSDNGTGTAATFYQCNGLLADATGNFYVADMQLIRKVTAAGVVTTYAGKPGGGNADGTLTTAEFNGPAGMAYDTQGNIIVADLGSRRIRKINVGTSAVTTVAGSSSGYVDAVGTAAKFENPNSVAVDASGNIFVADRHRIRKITADGTVSTYAGMGTAGDVIGAAATAQFNQISYLTVDSDGNLVVCDAANGKIKKISTAGNVTTFASGMSGPSGIAYDQAKNMYVPDAGFLGFRVRKITPAGVVSTFAGSGTPGGADGALLNAEFYFPNAIAISSTGVLYVAEGTYYRIRKIY